MRRRIVLLTTSLIVLIFLISCNTIILINDNGFQTLTASQREKVKQCAVDIETLPCDTNIYRVTADQVREYLSTHNDVIIYSHLTFCKSEYCESPVVIEQECAKAGFDLLVILGCYDYFDLIQLENHPLLVIEHRNYETYNYQKLLARFYGDLTGKPKKEFLGKGNKYYFHQGKFVKNYDKVADVVKIQ